MSSWIAAALVAASNDGATDAEARPLILALVGAERPVAGGDASENVNGGMGRRREERYQDGG